MQLPLTHLLLAVLITAMWGFNFVFVQLGLHNIPPLVLCLARFLFSSIPAIFFCKFPRVSLSLLTLFGLVNFALQYGLLFVGMKLGMPAGLAAVLYQTQVIFTILFAKVFFKEKLTSEQGLGVCAAFLGIGIIAAHVNTHHHITFIGLILTIAGASSWSLGNIIVKKMGKVNSFAVIVWGNFIATPPMLALAWFATPKAELAHMWHNFSWLSAIAIFYIAYVSTLGAFSIWSYLIQRHPLNIIAPFTVLVPIFGMIGATFVLHEPLQSWKLIAAALIISGLVISIMGSKLRKKYC